MEFFEKYKKHIIIGGVLLLFLISSVLIYYKNSNKDNNKTRLVDAVVIENKEEVKEDPVTIEPVYEEYYVDIKGAVINPGVYKLNSDSRVNDVINLAGGTTNDADTRCVNLSKKIKDEMVIYVYTKQETEEMYSKNKKVNNIILGDVVNDAYIDYTNPNSDNANNTSSSDEQIMNSKININTADISILTSLPNIGESKAMDIIAKREELGGFTSIEQLMEVKGIGNLTFEKLKDLVSVE